jgi:hypothetical protein
MEKIRILTGTHENRNSDVIYFKLTKDKITQIL